MDTKNTIDSYAAFGKMASNYGKQYEINFKEHYPTNRFRRDIVLSLLEQIKPKKILDVGCGSGEPLVSMLSHGFNAYGFDYADEMVDQAKETLAQRGFPKDRVHQNNMESVKGISVCEYDCLLALGSIIFARNFEKTVTNLTKLLPDNGHFVFSLRNELFSLFTLNKYSGPFFLEKLVPKESFIKKDQQQILNFFSKKLQDKVLANSSEEKYGWEKTVDELNIHSISHNPLTILQEVLAPNGLALEGLYFYHYHALPPIFEKLMPEEFRKASAKLENPQDWRGHFMASAFIVHARKLKSHS